MGDLPEGDFPGGSGARGFPWQQGRALAAAQGPSKPPRPPSKPPRPAAGAAPKMGADGHRPMFEPTAFWGELQPSPSPPPPRSQVSPMKWYLQNQESMEPMISIHLPHTFPGMNRKTCLTSSGSRPVPGAAGT